MPCIAHWTGVFAFFLHPSPQREIFKRHRMALAKLRLVKKAPFGAEVVNHGLYSAVSNHATQECPLFRCPFWILGRACTHVLTSSRFFAASLYKDGPVSTSPVLPPAFSPGLQKVFQSSILQTANNCSGNQQSRVLIAVFTRNHSSVPNSLFHLAPFSDSCGSRRLKVVQH